MDNWTFWSPINKKKSNAWKNYVASVNKLNIYWQSFAKEMFSLAAEFSLVKLKRKKKSLILSSLSYGGQVAMKKIILLKNRHLEF